MRKRERLIPVAESKKIIQLDRRGPVKEKKPVGGMVLGILSLLCLIYCIAILFFMGYGTKFFLIWGVLSVFLGGLSWLRFHPRATAKIPKFFRRVFLILCLAGILCFCGVEGMILSSFGEKPAPGADYVVVLGAQWKTGGPSYVLQKRLDAAVGYLKENPDTLVIVSGGQGSDEPISEAQGMKEYLIHAGIAEERILMEDTSTSTKENLQNSGTLLDKKNDRVVLVTNNFHMFRACGIARHQGYAKVEGLSARSYPAMLPNNLLREFFGVIKDTLAGNM